MNGDEDFGDAAALLEWDDDDGAHAALPHRYGKLRSVRSYAYSVIFNILGAYQDDGVRSLIEVCTKHK